MELLEVMLEETNKECLKLAQGLAEDLDVDILLKTMMQLCEVSSIIVLLLSAWVEGYSIVHPCVHKIMSELKI